MCAGMLTYVVGEVFPGGQRVVEQREAQFSSKFAWEIQRIRGWGTLTKYLRQRIHDLYRNNNMPSTLHSQNVAQDNFLYVT